MAAELQPDFRTISDFRKENEKLITELFKNTVKAAKDLGVIGLEQLSTDGSMVKASASKKSTIIEDVFVVIGEYVNNELKKGIELDKIEDEAHPAPRVRSHCARRPVLPVARFASRDARPSRGPRRRAQPPGTVAGINCGPRYWPTARPAGSAEGAGGDRPSRRCRAREENRTPDLLITSELLCRLSYPGGHGSGDP